MTLQDTLREAIGERKLSAVREAAKALNPVDISEIFEEIPMTDVLITFRMLEKEQALAVFTELSRENQQAIIEAITDQEIISLLSDMWMDDKLVMLEELPATLVKKVLRVSSHEAREVINQYLNYPDGSTGNIMTAEFMEVQRDMTVAEALSAIQQASRLVETVYTCFVTDATRILEGAISLKTILLAKDEERIGDLMDNDPVYVTTLTDKQETIAAFLKYDLITLPVVDAEHRLVGLVTVDDAVDALVERDTEDFERMAAILPSDKPYLKTSAFRLAMNRFPWLVVSLLTNIIVSFVVNAYSPIYIALPVLVSFIPMLMGTGGNAGSQTSTMVIRSMALSDTSAKDFFKVLWKEIRVAMALGTVLAIFCFIRLEITNPGEHLIALLVSLSLLVAVFVGKSTGVMLPMLAGLVKADPALMASPLVSTIVDILALMAYFTLSGALLLPA